MGTKVNAVSTLPFVLNFIFLVSFLTKTFRERNNMPNYRWSWSLNKSIGPVGFNHLYNRCGSCHSWLWSFVVGQSFLALSFLGVGPVPVHHGIHSQCIMGYGPPSMDRQTQLKILPSLVLHTHAVKTWNQLASTSSSCGKLVYFYNFVVCAIFDISKVSIDGLRLIICRRTISCWNPSSSGSVH